MRTGEKEMKGGEKDGEITWALTRKILQCRHCQQRMHVYTLSLYATRGGLALQTGSA